MATSEIEKLERRYTENPHGLTFAPLAEVHRKNGDIARALELLTAGLELHPNYIPASIVLGRCHQDLGDLPSAEAAFAHVLRLDDENVIALKSLADIDERLERFAEAENWLRRLISVDRSNDEASEQLRRIETAKQGEKGSDAVSAAPAPILEMIDLTPEPVADSPKPTRSPAELLPVDIAAMELNRTAAAWAAPAAKIAPVGRDEEPGHTAEPTHTGATAAPAPVEASSPPKAEETPGQEEAVQPLPGLISAEFQPPLEATGGLGVETSEEVVLEVSGESEFRVPDASEDFRSLAARLNPPPAAPPVESQRGVPPALEPASKPRAEPEFVVTEAMADVLMQQGYPADALRVYRELARQNGDDGRLHSRIQEVEAAVARQSAKRQSYVAADTKGQSVAAFFRALVAARPQADPGSPDRPVSPGPATGDQKTDPAVSFDDFFDSEADGSTPLRQNSDPGKDDLDQFQSWLQNLKR